MTEADIPPGGEGEIKVTFNTGRKQGNQKKVITVTSNDPVTPNARLFVTAVIEVEFGFDVRRLDFKQVEENESSTKPVKIVVKDPATTQVTRLETSSPHIQATLSPAAPETDNPKETMVDVTILPTMPPGRINETVTAHSNLISAPKATLMVVGTKLGQIDVKPDKLHFMIKTTDSLATQVEPQKIVLTNRSSERPSRILSARDPHNSVSAELETIEEGQRYEVTVALRPTVMDETRNLSGNIFITTDNPAQPEIKVKYTIFHM